MGWTKGQPRGEKTGGRKAGVPNRRTEDLKERLEDLLGGQDLPGVILAKLKKLPVERQVNILMELMPYVYPRRKHSETKTDIQQQLTFTDIVKFMHDNDLMGEGKAD